MSTIFRVEKNSNYTVMSNYHIQDQSISWKAKGLLSTILSLPPNWDYTLAGLATIAKDGLDSTRAGVDELEDNGYVNRKQTRDEFGRMSKNEYTVFERPEDNVEFMAKKKNKAQTAKTSQNENLNKTIKQIADELDVSKQAVWQRIKRSPELSAMLEEHSDNINGTIHVDVVLEQLIKAQYLDRNITETSVNVDGVAVNAKSTAKTGYNTMFSPSWENPTTDNPTTGKPLSENPMQLNTKELNTKEKNTEYINQSNQSFRKQEYISSEKKIDEDVERITLSPSQYKNWICSNIDYEALIAQHENEKAQIDEIVDNMIEMLCCTASEIQISGVKQPIELVKSRIMKIDSECIDYILLCLERNTTKVRNMKAYLRTVIFNAPSTAANYIASEVNNTLYG